ncbi:MAG TPA: LicD family protein [Treponemataceae bacterium]|nr:LicD family protein [Treponemataceae bacterium]
MKATSKASVKETQAILLYLFKEVKAIFEKNNIPYFFIYGSLLGAVRHNGFIPWDDDLDICVDKKHYEKAIQLLKENLPKTIFVHNKDSDPIYWLPFTKIRYKNSKTTCLTWPEDNAFIHTGICLDIYRYWKEKKWSPALAKCIAIGETLKRIDNSFYNYSFFGKFTRKIKHSLRYVFYFLLHCFSLKKSMYCLDPISMTKPLHPEDMEDKKTISFEGLDVPIPLGYDRILKDEYGDYMTLPPEDKRQQLYTNVEIYG